MVWFGRSASVPTACSHSPVSAGVSILYLRVRINSLLGSPRHRTPLRSETYNRPERSITASLVGLVLATSKSARQSVASAAMMQNRQ
jgi:hypothetical protein